MVKIAQKNADVAMSDSGEMKNRKVAEAHTMIQTRKLLRLRSF